MSYLVLARKWRPQTFSDVVGQEVITKTLANAIGQNRVAHALLFCGPRGVGKTSVARILAKSLNCEKGPTPEPCGTCPACREISHGTNLDIHEIDGASNNGVDEIRKFKETVAYLPVSVRYKVYIIDEVHMLSKSAFNALLKTLEEPPAHVIFILATTEVNKIPPTILSRCQRYDFRRIPFQSMVAHLKRIVESEGFTADEKALMLVAREATGSLRDAEVVLDQLMLIAEDQKITIDNARSVLSVLDSSIMLQMTQCIRDGEAEGVLSLVNGLIDSGMDLNYFYRSFLFFLHDLLMLKISGEKDVAMERPGEEIQEMREAVRTVSLEQIEQWLRIFHERERFVLNSDYARIGLEATLLKAVHIAQVVSMDSLIGRLEKALGGKPVPAAPAVKKIKETPETQPAVKKDVEIKPAPVKEAPEREASPGESWDFSAFLSFVREKAMPLAAQLENAVGFQWEGEAAVILFPPGDFSMKLLQGLEKKSQIKSLLKAFTGREVKELILKEGERPALGADIPETGKTLEKPRSNSVADHPAVREALGILEGKLIEIKKIDNKSEEKK